MKLVIDPIAILKDRRREQVNLNFATLYTQNAHRYAAHARKREIAKLVLEGAQTIPTTFEEEAEMRGMSIKDFAESILGKATELDEAELRRQKVHARIDAATSVEELNKAGEIDA